MDILEILVIQTLIQRKVDAVIGSLLITNIINMTCSRKILLELVKGACHHPICKIESLLHTISMVNVYVNIQDSLVGFKEFQYRQNTIVDVTKSTGLTLFCVVKPARPVNCNITISFGKKGCCCHRTR